MIRRPPRSTRKYTLCPHTTLLRSKARAAAGRHPDACVLAGRISLCEEGEAEGPVFTDYERLFSFPQSLAARGNCATANWMSRRTIFEELGGFDHHLKSGCDRQMALRIRDAGLTLIYVPDMTVQDRKSVVLGKSVSVRVDLGVCRSTNT